MRARTALRSASLSFAMIAIASSVAQSQLPGSTIQPTNTISLTSFSPDSLLLNTFAFAIALRNTVSGLTPTHYRTSHFSDFHDAQWLPYEPTPHITSAQSWFTPDAGQTARYSGALYFQVRARNPNAGKPVSLTSGGGGVTVQPDFLNSTVRNKTIRVIFAG